MSDQHDTEPRSATEAPPAPGADAAADHPDLEQSGTEHPAPDSSAPGTDEGSAQPDDAPNVTSPTLEHLDGTIKSAKRAAQEALAPQHNESDE